MNILLVDDDQYLLDTIRMMVNWEAVGIDGVYSAGLVSTAKKIICSEPIDLMLCDIEMAKENGLELIAWCREQTFDIGVVILSSYARFDYAQKAIQLDSNDYLVKPVSYPVLEHTLTKLVEEVKQKRAQKDAIAAGRKTQVMLTKLYWKWFLEQRHPDKSFEDGWNQWLEMLESHPDNRYRLLMLDNPEYQNELEAEKRGMEDFTIRDMLTRLEECYPYRLMSVFRAGDRDMEHHIAVIKEPDTCGSIRSYACDIVKSMGCMLEKHCRCYVGEILPLRQLPENLRQIYRMVADTIAENNRIYFLESYIWKQTPYSEPAFQEWKLMILNGNGSQATEAIDDYLDGQVEGQGLNSKVVQQFLLNFQYMIYEIMKERQMLVRYIDDELNRDTFSTRPFYSITSLKKYINRIMSLVCGLIRPEEENGSEIRTVLAYIDAHLGEELNRDTFANVVYLNPNYMARLFKKEMGISLGNYLMQQRVERAKYLLAHTKIPINMISTQVGYDNFSYFSKVFRRIAGCSPNEYRKQQMDHKE